ncbi:MAG: hypothetical protein Cons2KO_11660 [Congregibacter sp.]
MELPPGRHAPNPPEQTQLSSASFDRQGFTLHPRASFSGSAKLLSKRRYRWDRLTPLVPWDFAIGWGVLSDETWVRDLKVTQGSRFMFWHLYDSPLNLRGVELSSANVHIIPANDEIENTLASIPAGALVHLRGELVDLELPGGERVPTSLIRSDIGPGACEILFLREIQVQESI